VFTVEFRDRVRDRVLELARNDARVVAGAAVGSSALGGGDRWSDLDLTFGVEGDVPITEVADDWGAVLLGELDGIHLFDLWRESAMYRVFLLPGCLQVDLSFAPASEFGARGPGFSLLFGTAVALPTPPEPQREELFGLAVHHAVRARFCIERGRVWQAEFWIHTLRDHALELACLHRGLPVPYGRGFDALPAEAHDEGALVRSLDRDELLRALGCVVAMLVREAGDLAGPLDARLRELTAS
jgi:hypothetical protein